jgi:hypothetical protein
LVNRISFSPPKTTERLYSSVPVHELMFVTENKSRPIERPLFSGAFLLKFDGGVMAFPRQPESTSPFVPKIPRRKLRGLVTTEKGRSNCTAFVRRANAYD